MSARPRNLTPLRSGFSHTLFARSKGRGESAMQACGIGLNAGEKTKRLNGLVHAHPATVQYAGALRGRRLNELSLDWRIDDVSGPMRRFERRHRHWIARKAAHTDLSCVYDAVRSRDVTFEVACDAAARWAVMRREIGLEGICARAVKVMNDKDRNAQIHQGKGDGAPGATGTDLHHRCILRTAAPEAFFKAAAKANSIKVVTGGSAVRRNRDGIDRADLSGLRIHRIEKRVECPA